LTDEEEEQDRIPVIGFHRGIGLHDFQDEDRLQLVRVEIDTVAEENDLQTLAAWSLRIDHAPESRLFAAEKVMVALTQAGNARRPPDVTPEKVRAHVAGLSSQTWRDPDHFCSILDAWQWGNFPLSMRAGRIAPVERKVRLTRADRGLPGPERLGTYV
jgi:hypothetical protein